MSDFIHVFLLLPLASLLLVLFLPAKSETWISRSANAATGIQFAAALGFTLYWLFHQMPTIEIKEFSLVRSEGYEFFISFYFDSITAVYLLVGSFLTFMVTIYSRYYMHRENGYKRFFVTILFFYLGYNTVIFSGNIETLFIGWEILGISSFLLIAFYRNRYLPVKNAMKVFSIYRIGDIGLILAMWMSHHLWHENITFARLMNSEQVQLHLQEHHAIGLVISLMILLAAAAKSAQLPFSSWLPRAMEGPTPSSAIFYASLSVHIGAFILLRTFPFWEHQLFMRILIVLLGLSTALAASAMARVQSSIKSQIAYSSIAQIGLIFLEIAMGLQTLALIHFAGNAFLRSYQLLVSPSVVSYMIREQFFNFPSRKDNLEDRFSRRVENSLYVLSLKEFNLDTFMFNYLWQPLKWCGNQLAFLSFKRAFVFFFPLFAFGLFALFVSDEIIPSGIKTHLPAMFSLFGLILTLKAFSERKNTMEAWFYLIMNHCWNALAISFNEFFNLQHVLLYLSGICVSGVLGILILRYLKQNEKTIDLSGFHGMAFEYPKTAFLFLLACLGMSGFPITPTFIGEDLIFSHIRSDQYVLVLINALSFIIDGLAIMRIYSRLFLGPHSKNIGHSALRSS